MHKKILLSIAAMTVFGSVVYGAVTTKVAAHGIGNSSMAATLASKLGIEESRVQTALDELKTEKKSKFDARVQSNLDDLVANGTLTEEQKNKILAKREELEAKRQAERTELEKWANDNGIDLKYLFGKGHGKIGKRGR